MYDVIIQIDQKSVDATAQAATDRLEAALVRGVERLLTIAEEAQATSYTASSNPDRLNYERTFTLQSASETEMLSTRLPEISGEWRINEGVASYGRYVLGKRSEQAPIHRDRWKSEEEVEAIVESKQNDVINEELNRAKIQV